MANDTDIINHIAQEIDATARGIFSEHSDWVDARDDMQEKAGAVTNKRLMLCSQIAKVADSEAWSDENIKAAIKIASGRIVGNSPSDSETTKAMQVFVSQVTLAAHESVRAQFDSVADVIKKAWDAEQEQMKADKKAGKAIDTPIKKFTSRQYELVLRACREIINPGSYGRDLKDGSDRLILRTVRDVIDWARDNDPDLDPVKVAGRLDTMLKAIKEIASVFADTDQHDLHVVASTLAPWIGSGDTKGTKLRQSLARARAARQHAAETKASPETRVLAPVPTKPTKPAEETVTQSTVTPEVPVSEPEPATSATSEEGEPLDGVFSIDDTLNDSSRVTLRDTLSKAAQEELAKLAA